MTNQDKAKQLAEFSKVQYPHGMDSYDECYDTAMAMAEWKDSQQTETLTTHPEGSNLMLHKHFLEMEDVEGFVSRSVLCRFDNKELIAINVISARTHTPHTIISVRVNGQETLFGQDTKKAIEFYNQQ